MPMVEEEKTEILQRLLTAHGKTREVFENEPAVRELHPGTEIASNWTVITAAYSGLEQTLKFLIADELGLTVPELIAFRDGKVRPYQTHHLSELFSGLTEPTQDVIREFYGRFQSLHSYIGIRSVDEFLGQISEADGGGYVRWRYTLIEDRQLPTMSPEALLAIWGACVQLAEVRTWENQQVQMPNQTLAGRLCDEFQEIVLNVCTSRQNDGEPFRDISQEARDWLWRSGHPLNSIADVLWHFRRYGEHGQPNVSEWLSDALTRWARVISESPSITRRTSLRSFVARARGETSDGGRVRWNTDANRFEPVPWSLEDRQLDALPPSAVPIGDPSPRETPLCALWQAAKESGYRVLENQSFIAHRGRSPWSCTHEVQSAHDGDASPILAIWQRRNDYRGLLHMVVHQPREELTESVRRWIDNATLLGELRAGRSRAGTKSSDNGAA